MEPRRIQMSYWPSQKWRRERERPKHEKEIEPDSTRRRIKPGFPRQFLFLSFRLFGETSMHHFPSISLYWLRDGRNVFNVFLFFFFKCVCVCVDYFKINFIILRIRNSIFFLHFFTFRILDVIIRDESVFKYLERIEYRILRIITSANNWIKVRKEVKFRRIGFIFERPLARSTWNR